MAASKSSRYTAGFLLSQLALLALLAFLLMWRYRVGLTRFFDVDEFTYLHWAGQVARGDILYQDIYTYFTPGLLWLLTPIFWLYTVSTRVFVVGRALAFLLFLGQTVALSILFGLTRGWRWLLLPAIIFSFLPMPYDKLLEIRPDNLGVLILLLAIIAQVQSMRLKFKSGRWGFLAGFLYGLSLLSIAKMLPVVGVAAAVAVFFERGNPARLWPFAAGMVAPWVAFFGFSAVSGTFSDTWYSLTRLVFEASKGAVSTPMGPDLLFYPNSAFYAGGNRTITTGLIVNHAFWIAGLAVGLHRLLSAFSSGKREIAFRELLIAGVFFVSVWAYVEFFPLKHGQYLIPISVFIAYYTADGLAHMLTAMIRRTGYGLSLLCIGIFVYILSSVTVEVNTVKLGRTLQSQLTELETLLVIIPPESRVVDLEGRMVFWPEGYPVCCLPFDLFLKFVSRPVPPLNEYLEQYPAQYIFQGDSNRLANLSQENFRYITAVYEPVEGWGEKLWRRKEEGRSKN